MIYTVQMFYLDHIELFYFVYFVEHNALFNKLSIFGYVGIDKDI